MPARKPLRAVAPGEREIRPKSIVEAAASGTTRDLLVVSRRLHELVRDIEAIDARAEDDASRTDVTDAPFDATAI